MKGFMLQRRTICRIHTPSAPYTKSRCRSSTGFSIIEMMIALVLIAIGSALALPSYQNMVEKRQLTRGAEQLLAFMNSAQSRSIQWNERLNVSWSRTGDTEWCVGANLGDTVCNCTVADTTSATFCDINNATWIFDDGIAGDRVLLKSLSGDAGGDNSFSFDPDRGLFVNLNDSLAIDIHSRNENYQLQLLITNTGQASLCSKDADHAIPGYSVCPAEVVDEEISES
jgi:type IV fimbrial biogenesis protein FimT